MNYQRHTNESSASTPTDSGRGGSSLSKKTPAKLLSKCLIVTGIVLGVVLFCGLTLRTSVSMISEQASTSKASGVDHTQSRAHKLSQRAIANERVREEARRADRQLLQDRRDRLWSEDSRPRTNKNDAYQRWYSEVREIEEQLSEAEIIQANLSPEEAAKGPLAEGTVLWHRKQRLIKLRADAPQL
jgi:uncharacterized membrane protein